MKIYTDGSYRKSVNSKVCGYAAIFITNVTDNRILYDVVYGIKRDKEIVKYWNVGGEIVAAAQAIEYATNHYSDREIDIYHDYLGIGMWANGKWKTNNEVTRWYKNYVRKVRDEGYNIIFHHVKGHSGDKLNEIADFYACKKIQSSYPNDFEDSEILLNQTIFLQI